jgi:ABC-2 type transport system permease protein
MMTDSWTIAVKEWREWSCARTRLGWGALAILIVVWSVAVPLLFSHLDAAPLVIPITWAALPLILAGVMITDSIAGERERQTLETLLASRLSDRAIVLGKVAAVTLLGWLLLLLGTLPGLLQQVIASPTTLASYSALALVAVSAPCVLLIVIAGAWFALYTASARFALLLTTAFAASLILGVTGLAFWWYTQCASCAADAASPLVLLSATLSLIDLALLGGLLLSVQRARLLAIG